MWKEVAVMYKGINKMEVMLNELIEKNFPDNLSDPTLVELAREYEYLLSNNQKKAS